MTEQSPIGYVTITETENEGKVIYGVFDTAGDALSFGSNLTNVIAYPIYAPVLH